MKEKKDKKEQDEIMPVFFKETQKEERKVVKRYRFKNDAIRIRYRGNVIENYQLTENFISLYRHTPLYNLIEEY